MKALFLGLATLDILYKVSHPPAVDEKIVASDQCLAAGGPATNAAITFAFLGGDAILHAAIGAHPVNAVARQDILARGVEIRDMTPAANIPLSFSSVMVKEDTGERSVVSLNARKIQADFNGGETDIASADLLLVDGHQMEASLEACRMARRCGTRTVLDGGSWKARMDELLPLIDYALCSERFHPPGCQSTDEVFAFLAEAGVGKRAITRGGKPILYEQEKEKGEIPVDALGAAVVDTLGAGDIFHGAFCYYLLETGDDFVQSLQKAARVAAFSCRFFGTRAWMAQWPADGAT